MLRFVLRPSRRPSAILLFCAILLAALLAIQTNDRPQVRTIVHQASADYQYGQGYIEAGANGGAYAFGSANFYGSTFSLSGQSAQSWFNGGPIVGVSSLPSGSGYLMVANNPLYNFVATCAFGSAQAAYYLGGPGSNWCFESYSGADDAVGVVVDPANNGYWVVESDGGIFAFDGAPFLGNAFGLLNSTTGNAVAIASTPDGSGYWVVTSNGYLYAFGGAAYSGAIGGTTLAKPIVGIAAGSNDSSYWMVGGDGGVFNYPSSLPQYGSLAGQAKYFNIMAVASTQGGGGFYLMAFDGSLYTFGDAKFQNDLYGNGAYGQIAGVAAT